MSRWGVTRLVAERELREKASTRTFFWTTVVLLLTGLALVIVPSLVGGGDEARRVAVAPPAPAGLASGLTAVGEAAGERVEVREVADRAEAERAVRDGEVDAAVVGAAGSGPVRVLVGDELADELGPILTQAVASARVGAALEGAGVPPAESERLLAPTRLDVAALEPQDTGTDAERGIGVIVAVVLYLALLTTGIQVATGVAQEKTSRIAEVLLATIRPTQLLAGKVLGIGLLGLIQLAAVGVPILVAVAVTDAVDLPESSGRAVAAGLLWFVAGYALYAAAFAALGALVARLEEVSSATAPLSVLLLVGYLVAAVGAGSPDGTLVTIASFVPPLAPMVMPLRIATGTVAAWEVAVSVALTLALAWALVVAGARVYRRAIVRGGPRLSLRQAWRTA